MARRRLFLLLVSLGFFYFVGFLHLFLLPFLTADVRTGFILNTLPMNCSAAFHSESTDFVKLRSFFFRQWKVEKRLLMASSDEFCPLLHRLFYFPSRPLSKEEADYPIAYGILIHKDFVQFLFMLSSIYHPQNEYAVAVDSSSRDANLHRLAFALPTCFHNVHVFKTGPVKWCGPGVMHAVMETLRLLTAVPTPWKYFQYLSGVDAPLKTNLEMVRIFKALNGSLNVEVKDYQLNRLLKQKREDSPMPLFKSSLSSLLSREIVEVLVIHPLIRDQMAFLSKTNCPDEALWATFTGNPSLLPLPGGFDAAGWLKRRKKLGLRISLNSKNTYYVSRLQHWGKRGCYGRTTSGSCVFGVGDLPRLFAAPHLVAHKFYLNTQPAAFFCLLKEIEQRTMNPSNFSTTFYENLVGVQLHRGRRLEDIHSL